MVREHVIEPAPAPMTPTGPPLPDPLFLRDLLVTETADSGTAPSGLRRALLEQAEREGLTDVVIEEELDLNDCGCDPPYDDGAYLLSADRYSALCACLNENERNPSSRFIVFPAE